MSKTSEPIILEQAIKREQFSDDVEDRYLNFIKSELAPRYAEFIGHEIQKAYLESYSEYGQNLFDRYIAYADAWIEERMRKQALPVSLQVDKVPPGLQLRVA